MCIYMATNDKLNYNFVGVQLTSRARTLKGGGGYRSYSYQANWGQTDRFRSEGAAGVSRGGRKRESRAMVSIGYSKSIEDGFE